MKFINHKENNFPPRSESQTTEKMLKDIAATKPNYAFVVEWPTNGDLPVFHTSTEDAPVLAFRLQNFLDSLYSGKIKLEITK